MLIAERVLSKNIDKYGKHPSVSSDGGGTWYPHQACQFLKLQHHFHSSYEKSLIERTIMQYVKDRTTESFDDYFFPCFKRKKKCKLKHVINWLKLFVDFHNKELRLK